MRDAVLYTLAQAALVGSVELAPQPASAVDPLLRPFVKAQVRAAITSAAAATKLNEDEHVLRLAFLRKRGSLPDKLDVDDRSAVLEAFEVAAKPYEAVRKPSRRL